MFTKPGTVHLWSTSVNWTGIRTIRLQTQKLSAGSSALSPVSGVTYASSQDTLVVSLADGSLHVISNICTNPTLGDDDSGIGLSSSAVSTAARADFVEVEEEHMKKQDVNAMHGMVPHDQGSFYLWIHE